MDDEIAFGVILSRYIISSRNSAVCIGLQVPAGFQTGGGCQVHVKGMFQRLWTFFLSVTGNIW